MKFETYSALIAFFVCLNDVCNAEPLIWFSTKDTIKTTDVGTYKSQLIVSNIYGVSSISPFADYIYWTHTEDKYGSKPDKIMRAKKDGSNVEVNLKIHYRIDKINTKSNVIGISFIWEPFFDRHCC